MTLIKVLGLNLSSWHIFRRYRLKRVYKCLREFLKELNRKVKNRPARLERALTQRIKRGFGKKSWGRRKRKLYSIHRKEKIEIDTLVYGVLVMAVVDEVGRVADIWFYPANKHEGKGLKERLSKSRYLRKLFEKYNVLADRGYRGVDGVEICLSKELKSIRQRVECVFSKMKFLELSGWRNFICLLVYLSAFAVASFFP